MMRYERIYEKQQRLDKFEQNQQDYHFDIIEACIRDVKEAYSIDKGKHYEWEVFWTVYLLTKIYPTTDDAQIVFIDEFQDYSALEYDFIINFFTDAKFNLFGDFNQSISSKCITPSQLNAVFRGKKLNRFSIAENYRNAQEITEYVNNEFAMDMRPVGIHGSVHHITLNAFADLEFDENARVALIIDNPAKLCQHRIYQNANVIDTHDCVIRRGVINILPVTLAKGLEFETVAIIPENLSKNELYVGMTRALDSLYILS